MLCNNGSSEVDVDVGRRIGVLEAIGDVILPMTNQSMADDEFLQMFDVNNIPEEQLRGFQKLLSMNKNIFAMKSTDLRCAKGTKHKIELEDHTPVKEWYRRIPTAMYETCTGDR